jgi:hypothetical protein
MRKWVSHRLGAVVASCLLLSCGGSEKSLGPSTLVATVMVTPTTATLRMGQTTQLTAIPKDASGASMTGLPVLWQSSDSNGATVSASGLVTAVRLGTASITATVGGKIGAAALAISAPQGSRSVVVAIGGDVSAAARAQVQTFVSLTDSLNIGLAGRNIAVPDTKEGAIVLALNASGDPILAGSTDQGATVTLDASGTALAVARATLLASIGGLVNTSQLNTVIAADPNFPALVTAVRTSSDRGESFTSSNEVIQLLGALLTDLGPRVQPTPSISLVADRGWRNSVSSAGAFSNMPVSVSDGVGTSYTLTNNSFTWFAVTAKDGVTGGLLADQKLLERREINLSELPLHLGSPVATDFAGINGMASVLIGQSSESKDKAHLQIANDLFSVFVRLVLWGFNETVDNDTQRDIAAAVAVLFDPAFIAKVRDDPGQTVLNLSLTKFLEKSPEIAVFVANAIVRIYGTSAVAKAVTGFVSFAFLPVKVLLTLNAFSKDAVFAVDAGFFFSDFLKYGDAHDSATVCQDNGMFVPCGTLRPVLTVVGPPVITVSGGIYTCLAPVTVTVTGGDSGTWISLINESIPDDPKATGGVVSIPADRLQTAGIPIDFHTGDAVKFPWGSVGGPISMVINFSLIYKIASSQQQGQTNTVTMHCVS